MTVVNMQERPGVFEVLELTVTEDRETRYLAVTKDRKTRYLCISLIYIDF